MITALVAGFAMVSAFAAPPTACPRMGSPASASQPTVDYAGVRYAFCCGGCPEAFAKDPKKGIASERSKGKVIGTSLHDPVARIRVNEKGSAGSAEHNGVRYFFLTKQNLETFKQSPAKFSKVPAKDVLTCPVSGETIDNYARAYAYVDQGDTRYYVCCAHCFPQVDKDPAKFITKMKAKPVAPKAFTLAPGKDVQPEVHE